MNSDGAFMNAIVTIVSTLFGYGVVASKMIAKLDTKLYQAGAKAMWEAINRERDRITKLEGKNEQLEKDIAELKIAIAELKALK